MTPQPDGNQGHCINKLNSKCNINCEVVVHYKNAYYIKQRIKCNHKFVVVVIIHPLVHAIPITASAWTIKSDIIDMLKYFKVYIAVGYKISADFLDINYAQVNAASH